VSRRLLAIVLFVGLLSMLPGAIHGSFHCDEVNVFRHVSNFAAGQFGEPGRPGLLWLVLAPTLWVGDVATSMGLMRASAVLASLFTLGLVALLASRRPEDGPWGLVGAGGLLITSLAWQTHAFEVRTDTYTAPLTLAAAALLLRDRVSTREAIAAGALVGAAGLVSQKSIYNGVGLAAAWLLFHALASRPLDISRRLKTAGLAVLTAGLVVGGWYGAMALGSGSETFVADNLGTAVQTGFSQVWSLEKNLGTLGGTAGRSPLLWGLAPLAAVFALAGRRARPTQLAVGLIGGVLVATIVVHRGFRPYFVASFEPYLAVLSGGALGSVGAEVCRRVGGRAGVAAGAAVLLLALGWTANHNRDGAAALLATDNSKQLQVVADATEAFPEPVPYWDSVGLLPGYPETTFFGTGPSRTIKRKKSPGNMYVRLAREGKPRFFIRNYMTRDLYLRPDEQRWVWRHFVPYRDNLNLLGGRIRVGDGPKAGPMEVLVAGEYTVKFLGGWAGEATVDGAPVKDGDVVTLAEGTTRLAATTDGHGDLALYLGAGRTPREDLTDWSMYPRLRRDRYQQYDRRGKPADLLTPPNDPTMTPKTHRARTKKHEHARKKRRHDLAQP